MTQGKNDNLLTNLMELINENGMEAVADTFRILLNKAIEYLCALRN